MTIDQDILNFDFSEKGLGMGFPRHFVMILHEKCISPYILLPDQISLPNCLYFVIFGHYLYCKFEINILSNQALHDQNSRQEFKYLKNEKSF